jgi:capsular polysaccharide biosynthesis protein
MSLHRLRFMRAREARGVSVAEGVRRAILYAGKQALKTTATPFLAVARSSGLFGLARGSLHVDEALASHDRNGGVRAWQLDLSEPPRALRTLQTSDPIPPLRPVTTVLTILDGAKGTFAFCNNHVVNDRGMVVLERVTNEDGKSLPFRDLRVGRTPLDTPRHVAGSIAYLSNSGVGNFGHWLVLTFPLVQYYREYLGHDPDYYYVGTPIHEWHYDSLAALGIEADRILTDAVMGDRMLAACADNHVPASTSFLDFSTETLRLPYDSSIPNRRIYISRAVRPLRRLLNEEACTEVMAQHGFQPYRTEKLTLLEERELFANAEAVIAVCGAGLANLLFCHPRCVAVELFPHGFVTPWFDASWFPELSAVRGITYGSLYGEPTRNWGLRARDYDTLINLDKLDAMLGAATKAAAEYQRSAREADPGRSAHAR